MSISFGPSVLTHLQSKVPVLSSQVRVFALAILFRNGIALEEEYQGEFVRGLCDIHNLGLDSHDPQLSFLARPAASDILWRIVEEYTPEKSERAAEYLINYHSDRLSRYQRAKCNVLYFNSKSYFLMGSFRDQVKELQADPLYASEIERVSLEITAKGGKRPSLDLLREALANEAEWEAFIWEQICDNTAHKSDSELQGQFLLEMGRDDAKIGKSIGDACKRLLDDPRISGSYGDAKEWLAILADEFAGLTKDKLEVALQSSSYSHYATSSAVLARLGFVPADYRKRDAVGSVPDLSKLVESQTPRTELLKSLREVTRDSTQIHPNLCNVLEALLFEPPLSNDEKQSITANGKQGTLAVTALSFMLEQPPQLRDYISLFPFWLPAGDKNPCFNRLRNLCRHGSRALIKDEATRDEYLALLDNALESDSGEIFFLATELLVIRGTLTANQCDLVLSNYARNLVYQDYGLGNELVKWIATDLVSDEAASLVEYLKRGIEVLDNHPWDKDELRDAFRFMFFPLAYWKLVGKGDDQSMHVFLRGMKFMFSRHNDKINADKPHEIVRRVEPLLMKVSRSILNEAIKVGEDLEDPVVRGFCRLFQLAL